MAHEDEDQDVDLEDAGLAEPGPGGLSESQLNEKYPNRPHNHSKTQPFHDLFLTLFDPLNENKKKPPAAAARKKGRFGHQTLSPHQERRAIIERFISRWRRDVGDDIYPAFRLILPERDRDRSLYGLKEKAIGKLLVKLMKIDKNSEDGFNLLNWKQPGQTFASRMAGDFPGRCYEVLSKRPLRVEVGDMTIEEVNDLLDSLASSHREEDQLPILEEAYKRMNAQELMWIIRIILRQMKIGATEKTVFEVWHPDAETLYNVSSSLRRVCWELHNPAIRLDGNESVISIMQCFQPQLAQFQMRSFERMVESLRPTDTDPVFWVEEKLDGERMQLHMIDDDNHPGGMRFQFWSRRAKEYTYLYGDGFEDKSSALTQHIREAFNVGVRSLILDGEMITWDPVEDAVVPFGTLKSAAIAESRNPFTTNQRPLFRVFDILYLNGEAITGYTLRDRRRALEASIKSISRRIEIHQYIEAESATEVETLLRKVVAEASEGLVLKNPRSMYQLNERNDDWVKVKPEYMTEFGESLDLIVIGGYYGSGNRGGKLSSFLCGLRVEGDRNDDGADSMKCYSFVKVGGGFTAADYGNIRHHTDGKWKEWDAARPPTDYIELGGGDLQYERPDVWIKPDDSVVLEVKAAQVTVTDSFRTGCTLRFPRFRRLRMDRDWKSALSLQAFLDLKANIEHDRAEKEFKVDDRSRRIPRKRRRQDIVVAGNEEADRSQPAGAETKLFEGLNFFIITESLNPKKSKAELEQLVKSNGGKIYQTNTAVAGTICIGERRTVKVASLQKRGIDNVVRPLWLLDCIKQNELGNSSFILPLEPRHASLLGAMWMFSSMLTVFRHMFFTTPESRASIEANVDTYGDSYLRDVSTEELRDIFSSMPTAPPFSTAVREALYRVVRGQLHDSRELPGWVFANRVVYLSSVQPPPGLTSQSPGSNAGFAADKSSNLASLSYKVRFAGGEIVADLDDRRVTHVVIVASDTGGGASSQHGAAGVRRIREILKWRKVLPRIVTAEWVEQSWAERTLLDEERFAPP